jgi:hypothetical protein
MPHSALDHEISLSAELDALSAAVRAMHLLDIAADNWNAGKVDLEWTLDWVREAGQLASQALADRWPWLGERRSP